MNGKKYSNLGNKKVFSENLRYYLSRTGEMQKDIARVARVSGGTVSDWLSHRSYPRMDKIQLLAEHWGIQMSDLIDERGVDIEIKMIAKELADNPDTLIMFKEFQKLSPANREIVRAMISSLPKEGK
jgi:transcriptional regulator with XRE-family HTH domain